MNIDLLHRIFSFQELAKVISHASDLEQAAFINEMAKEMRIGCRDTHHLEMQHCYISDKLNDDGILMIKSLHEFILLREKNNHDRT